MKLFTVTTCWLSSRNFFEGGKIYCYANFSIVFRPNFGGQLPHGGTPVEESQHVSEKFKSSVSRGEKRQAAICIL